MTTAKGPQTPARAKTGTRTPTKAARPSEGHTATLPPKRAVFLVHWAMGGYKGPIEEALKNVEGAPEDAYWWEGGEYLFWDEDTPIYREMIIDVAGNSRMVALSEHVLEIPIAVRDLITTAQDLRKKKEESIDGAEPGK